MGGGDASPARRAPARFQATVPATSNTTKSQTPTYAVQVQVQGRLSGPALHQNCMNAYLTSEAAAAARSRSTSP